MTLADETGFALFSTGNHVGNAVSDRLTTSWKNTKRNICKKNTESLLHPDLERSHQESKLEVRNYFSFLGKYAVHVCGTYM